MGMTDEEAMLHDTLSELKRQLRSNDSAKIVLIGDVMMDCYIPVSYTHLTLPTIE